MADLITVAVAFMGPISRPKGAPRELSVELSPDATVEALLSALAYRPNHHRHLGVFRDGRRLPLGTRLLDGESVTITVPFGGG